MLRSFLTIAFRSLARHRLYAGVNIVGLALGIAFFTLLLMVVRYELSYDGQHARADRTYRVIELLERQSIGEQSASLPLPFARQAKADFPQQIEAITRIFNFQVPVHTLAAGGSLHSERRFFFADTAFFRVFSYPLAQGDPAEALRRPRSVLLSWQKAQEYFGGAAEAMGRELVYEGRDTLTVSGVFSPEQTPSHFAFDFLASFDVIQTALPGNTLERNWLWNPCWTYLVLAEGQSPEDLEYLFADFVGKHFPPAIRKHVSLYLQPLREIHLHSKLDYELGPNGDIQYVYIFSAIAVLMLLMAAINFVNLSTARSSLRAREVGLRKAMGAYRVELLGQFLVEFFLIGLVGIVLAMVLVELLLPRLSGLFGGAFDFSHTPWGVPLGIAAGSGLVAGGLASLYPAYSLSRFDAAKALRGLRAYGERGRLLRRILVVVQLMIAIFLMVTTLVSLRQHQHLVQHPLGFRADRVCLLPVANTGVAASFESFQRELAALPLVEAVTATNEVLGMRHQTQQFRLEAGGDWLFFPSLVVRHGFDRVFEPELLVGRQFLPGREDEANSLLVNEALARHLGYESPRDIVGQQLLVPGPKQDTRKTVVGVLRDFHFESLHQPVAPLVLNMAGDRFSKIWTTRFVAVRFAEAGWSGDGPTAEALRQVEGVWSQYLPDRVFEYEPLGAVLQAQYLQERRMGLIAGNFTFVALALTCLGLFGLSSSVMEQRKREIAVRKALGSSDGEIVILLSKEFVVLVLLAWVLASPLSYLLMGGWLESFPYRIAPDAFIFLFSGALALDITLITISFHTVRAARRHPVDAL